MQQKTITVLIDEAGNSSVDLDGFIGQGCEKVLTDFQGSDRARVQGKKPVFYSQTNEAQDQRLRSGR